MLLQYKYSNRCFLALIILDNNAAREYLVYKLKENIVGLCSLDFSEKNMELYKIGNVIKHDKNAIGLSGEILYSEFKKNFTDLYDMGQYLVYMGINMARDSVFLEYNATFFLVLSDKDYLDFIEDRGDDFASYSQTKPDFNSCFISDKGISLSEYYQDVRLNKILKR